MTTGATATASDPLETTVTTPNAGAVSITEEPTTATPPAGFGLLGLQATITAPAATTAQPLQIEFLLDASLLAAGNCGGPCDASNVAVFRNGTQVPACTSAPGTASPNPCVSARQALAGGDARLTVLTSTASVWTFGGRSGFPRPKGATPVSVSLVPAFDECTTPNRVHGPPLTHPSCAPPQPASNALTVGTPDANGAPPNFRGSVKLRTVVGVPGPPDDSDVEITASIADVRCGALTPQCGATNSAGGADYLGYVRGEATMRLTDRLNGASGSEGPRWRRSP